MNSKRPVRSRIGSGLLVVGLVVAGGLRHALAEATASISSASADTALMQ
jgi:hypothetical protein